MTHKICKMLISREILRAARGLVGWSVNKLGEQAHVGPDTIRSFESGRTKSLNADTQDKVQKALEGAGVAFLEDGDAAKGVGVSINKE